MTKPTNKGRGVNAKGRSKADGQYWSVSYVMLKSTAFLSLSGAEVRIYLLLRTRFNGSNNGKLFLSMDEAANLLGMSKSTVQAAFKGLEAKGFIKKTRKGRWYGRLASLYALTDRTLNGHLPTNDWKHWRPAEKTESRYSHRTKGAADGSAEVPKK